MYPTCGTDERKLNSRLTDMNTFDAYISASHLCAIVHMTRSKTFIMVQKMLTMI